MSQVQAGQTPVGGSGILATMSCEMIEKNTEECLAIM